MEFADNLIKEKFMQTMCTTKLTNHERESFENLSVVPKWTSPMAAALLSGKLITRGSKTLAPCKLLLESYSPSLLIYVSFRSVRKVSAGR